VRSKKRGKKEEKSPDYLRGEAARRRLAGSPTYRRKRGRGRVPNVRGEKLDDLLEPVRF